MEIVLSQSFVIFLIFFFYQKSEYLLHLSDTTKANTQENMTLETLDHLAKPLVKISNTQNIEYSVVSLCIDLVPLL